MSSSLIHALNRLAADRYARQSLRVLQRALWLCLCMWCIALGGSLVWGWSLSYTLLGSATLAIIGISLLLLLRRRMTALEVARRLDRRFHLDEQLATAVEIAATRRAPDDVSAHLLQHSGQTATHLQRRLIRRPVFRWADVAPLAALVLVLVGLGVLVAIGRANTDLASASLAPVPPLVAPPDQQLPNEPEQPADQNAGQQPGAGQQAGSTEGGADPQVTGPLADALREQGATRPAADALDRGDTAGAAQDLRALADQADQLSQESRNDLADQLRQNADRVEDRNQALADQMRQSAEGLEQGGNEAQQATNDLAQAVEGLNQPAPQTAQQGQQGQQDQQSQNGQDGQQGQDGQDGQQGQDGQGGQQGQGAQNGNGQSSGAGNSAATGQRQTTPSERLGVEGKPLELEAQGTGQDAERTQDQQPGGTITAPGRTSGGGGSGSQSNGTIGSDPLRIPVDERDVVQEYFTP